MHAGPKTSRLRAALGFLAGMLVASEAMALDRLDIAVLGGSETLTRAVTEAAMVRSLQVQGQTDPQDLLAAARSDYAHILAALYARGHYAVDIRILIDGREAAAIPALEAPRAISTIRIQVDPGPPFRFGQARIAPLAPGTELPQGFRPGEIAESGQVQTAVDVAISAWREAGHAKAFVGADRVLADHAARRIDADVGLTPGPRLRFGPLAIVGEQRMREARIRKIAGLPEGETFSETELRRAEARLRRTGIFSSVALTEDDRITAPDLLGITASVVEQKPRRYALGVEVASLDGLSLSASWLHRNLLGGGERLGVKGEITNIGASLSGIDYRAEVTLDRPATLTPDTTAGLILTYAHEDEIDYALDAFGLGLRFSHVFSEELTARVGLTYDTMRGRDPGGRFDFRNLSLPVGLTWDRRDEPTDPTRGFYLDATAKPFLGFGTTGSGLRATLDGRLYRSLGEPGRFVIAARAQAGAVLGPSLLETPRSDLFFSGGGGTVRGQPYRSLGVAVSRGFGPQFQIGGKYFLAGSVELRASVTDRIGVVGFVDWGSIGIDGFGGDFSNAHAGAGLGLRYDTGLGPIRLDVAAPVSGTTGDGVQIYVGLGQAF
ncbi:autotransporter assembly complex protein TamA [Rhodobacter calidifons]|uniref:BamA/TamA family outer membrane protein n=1 Tax=Rhodobacter calidifons TaxID=2715277 RepID=A0ABX0G417_9RHOB|nr:BamA/TamA family outer membrane protein [Rhodobacter calidifons]NHB75962.1 BamA/TamA family outer membrane protein [Rhodobacter calidifons]